MDVLQSHHDFVVFVKYFQVSWMDMFLWWNLVIFLHDCILSSLNRSNCLIWEVLTCITFPAVTSDFVAQSYDSLSVILHDHLPEMVDCSFLRALSGNYKSVWLIELADLFPQCRLNVARIDVVFLTYVLQNLWPNLVTLLDEDSCLLEWCNIRVDVIFSPSLDHLFWTSPLKQWVKDVELHQSLLWCHSPKIFERIHLFILLCSIWVECLIQLRVLTIVRPKYLHIPRNICLFLRFHLWLLIFCKNLCYSFHYVFFW